MLEILLPRTDLGALVQLIVVVATGVPLVVWLRRRRMTEQAWFAVGMLALLLGWFALRTVH